MNLGMNQSRNITPFATLVKEEIDEFIANGLLEVVLPLEDFEASLTNTSEQSDPSSPFVFPPNMTLEDYAQVIKQYKRQKKKKGFLIRGLYAPLLLPWVKRFAAEDRLMVMKFKDVFNESNVDEVLRFAGDKDTSIIDEHYDDFIRNRRGKIMGEADKSKMGDNHALKGKEIPLDPTIRLYLKFFYQPFNRFLVQLLGHEWERFGEV